MGVALMDHRHVTPIILIRDIDPEVEDESEVANEREAKVDNSEEIDDFGVQVVYISQPRRGLRGWIRRRHRLCSCGLISHRQPT